MKIEEEKSDYELPYVIYPKEFMGHMFLTIFMNGIAWPLFYIILEDKPSILMVIFGIFLLSTAIYYLMVSYCLVRKKIHIVISNEYVEVRKVFMIKRININDIKYIRQLEGSKGETPKIVLKSVDKRLKSKTDVWFPISWFSLGDIRTLKEILLDINNNIKLR